MVHNRCLDLLQLEAVSLMEMSQLTHNRILKSARGKVTVTIVKGCAFGIRVIEQNEAIQLSPSGDLAEPKEGI
jgi:predicted DNA-binding protein (UPF0251 family)